MTSAGMHDTPGTEASTSSPNTISKALETTLPSSTDPFLSGEIPPRESSGDETGLETDGAGTDIELKKGGSSTGQVDVEEEESERRLDLAELPPSSPLTRPLSREAPTDTLQGTTEGKEEPVEEEWHHPLDHTKSESKDLDQTQDTTFVEDSVAHVADEKHFPTSAPRGQTPNPNLRVVTKGPSPQPWDLVDPLPSNNGDATDYFSTLGTKNFGTLQKKSYAHPVINSVMLAF
jgi:hypothetical protein